MGLEIVEPVEHISSRNYSSVRDSWFIPASIGFFLFLIPKQNKTKTHPQNPQGHRGGRLGGLLRSLVSPMTSNKKKEKKEKHTRCGNARAGDETGAWSVSEGGRSDTRVKHQKKQTKNKQKTPKRIDALPVLSKSTTRPNRGGETARSGHENLPLGERHKTAQFELE